MNKFILSVVFLFILCDRGILAAQPEKCAAGDNNLTKPQQQCIECVHAHYKGQITKIKNKLRVEKRQLKNLLRNTNSGDGEIMAARKSVQVLENKLYSLQTRMNSRVKKICLSKQ